MAVHKQYNHIMNKHSGHDSTLFPKCLHGRLHGMQIKTKEMNKAR